MALMNTNGTIVARYSYDPWGAVTVMNSSGTVMTSPTFIGNINPLRYRGYYYDTETGFYYLQSRYYDPAIGRFISADSFASTGQGYLGCNMFAYCGNNPVCRADCAGRAHTTQLVSGWGAAKELTGYVLDLVVDISAVIASAIGIAGGIATAEFGGVVLTLTSLEVLHTAYFNCVYNALNFGTALGYTIKSGEFQYTTYSVFEQDSVLGKSPLNPSIKTIDEPARTVIKKAECNNILPQTQTRSPFAEFIMSGKNPRDYIFQRPPLELSNGWRPGYDLRGNPAGFGFWHTSKTW